MVNHHHPVPLVRLRRLWISPRSRAEQSLVAIKLFSMSSPPLNTYARTPLIAQFPICSYVLCDGAKYVPSGPLKIFPRQLPKPACN